MASGAGRGAHAGRAKVVVVAAGASRRIGFDKLEVSVAGRPLLAWTLERIAASPLVDRIVVVTSAERVDRLQAAQWLPERTAAVVAGGARRHESVAAGVAAVERLDGVGDMDPVLVHDGARPLVTPTLVTRVAEAVRDHGAAIPVVPLAETLKRVVGDEVETTVDRVGLATAQTPQGARLALFRLAYERFPPDGPEAWTDEAALFEACKIPVHAIAGDPGNRKVTLLDDLVQVEAALLHGRSQAIGFGSDSHPFGPGEPLRLGGIAIPGAPRLYGHSDGDVALHAIADALLGAAGLGDLGRRFPAGPSTPAGIASADLLRVVVGEVRAAGLRPVSIDLTIVAARPRLAEWLDAMREAIADLLELDRAGVSAKASTGNLAGMEGAGRGISAHALAVLDRTR